MRLVVLDGNALNPGDLSWSVFENHADVSVFPRTEPNHTADNIGTADAILLNKVDITQEIISRCPNLKYIGVLATGYNVVDVKAAKAAGICVTNIPAYSTMAVAQHVFSLITYFTNLVASHNASVQDGGWICSKDFCYWNAPLTELCGKTLGIFGYGNIGRQVAAIGTAFGMNVIVCPHKSCGNMENCVDVQNLFSHSDFLTLHAPLTDETFEIVNERTLSLMKRGSYIVNTARGALVNEAAVRAALECGRLSGYAADVLCEEPMSPDCPILRAPNCIITPHIAWAPLETRRRLLNIAAENFECWLRGSPKNTVC